ncbi:probable glutathione S-transferase parC [Malania oleifera]|uniref:probable glutathione S-transferase parC n=1 Tax=Malania oleifera TaxID=397392 RepID=UPI0025AE5081|nr:probable glutathione S-transferase parC [Malania oleifera]
MADKVVLLDFWPSMFGMRVRIALAEKGRGEYWDGSTELETKRYLPKQESLLLELKPYHRKSPVLIPMNDQMVETLHFELQLYGPGRKLFWSPEEHEDAGMEFIGYLKVLEGELGDEPFFGGETFGFVDIALITFYSWFKAYETYGNLSVESECPKLIAWAKRCLGRESVAMSLVDQDKVSGFIAQVRQELGLK